MKTFDPGYIHLVKFFDCEGKTPIPVHAMRSTCIKFHQEDGWSIAQVAALIGDKVATVQEYYDTPSNDELSRVMKEKGGI